MDSDETWPASLMLNLIIPFPLVLPGEENLPSRIANYKGFDFRGMWKSREKVTCVESTVLGSLLKEQNTSRVLDAGFGFGRLYDTIMGNSKEYYAIDVNPESYGDFPARSREKPFFPIVANLYNIPFGYDTFSGVVMMRVHHHLEKPAEVLSQFWRIIRPGGFLIITFNPRPSISTLLMDVKKRFSGKPGKQPDFITFRKEPFLKVAEDPFPIFSSKVEYFRREAEKAGFAIEESHFMGFEDIPITSLLPLNFLSKYPFAFSRIPLAPTIMFKLRSKKDGLIQERPSSNIFACPRCIHKLDVSFDAQWIWKGKGEIRCMNCGFSGSFHDGIIDLAFFN